MKISILSPVRNEEKHLPEMVASVLAQSHEDWELLFVDDGSTDATARLIRQYAHEDTRIRLLHEGGPLGKAAAFNLAFHRSAGDVIVLLAGDDILPASSLEVRARDMEDLTAGERRLAVYKLRAFSEETSFQDIELPRGRDTVSFSGGVLTMSRDLAKAVFPIDESLPSEDIWLGYAVPALATRVVKNPTVILDYRIHPGNSNPRHLPFPEMFVRMSARHEAWRLLLDAPLALGAAHSAKLASLWEAETHRRASNYWGIVRVSGLSVAERLSLLGMSHPLLFAVRQRFYRLLSGRQKR